MSWTSVPDGANRESAAVSSPPRLASNALGVVPWVLAFRDRERLGSELFDLQPLRRHEVRPQAQVRAKCIPHASGERAVVLAFGRNRFRCLRTQVCQTTQILPQLAAASLTHQLRRHR